MTSRGGGFPVKSRKRSAVARLKVGFGDPREHVSVEHFSLPAGTDIAPLLQQFADDLCDALPWGYVIEGGLSVTYRDGSTDDVEAGDVFYLCCGQSVLVEEDCELLMVNPRHWHHEVFAPVQMKMSRYRH